MNDTLEVTKPEYPLIPPIPPKLAKKLAEILGEIPEVPRLGFHEKQGYRYPRASDINAATRTVLSNHHVFPLWRPHHDFHWREFQSSSQNTMMREVTIWFDLTLIDADSGEFVTVEWPGVAADLIGSDKVLAKAETNALKTFLVMQFQIPDDTADSDRTAETDEKSKPTKQQQPNWPKQVRGVIQEVEPKADGWMVTVRGIHYWTKYKPWAQKFQAARGKELDFSAEIGKGPDGERCPVISKLLNVPEPTAPTANQPTSSPAPAVSQPKDETKTSSGPPRKEELF
jgi:hypothetical protein